MSDLTAVSLFAGIGGFELALSRAGVRTVASVEIDSAARGVLTMQFPHVSIFDDVRTVTGDQLIAAGFTPGRGIVTAGWPCQGNSVAGRRGGMADPRSGLWREVVRLLAELRPRWFFGENVPGILSLNRGGDFGTVVRDLANVGMGVGWRVLDAQHFGVPQQRRRVFIIGCSGTDARGPVEVLFDTESSGGNPAAGGPERTDVAGETSPGVGGVGADNPVIAQTLLANHGKNRDETFVCDGALVRRLSPLEKERLQGYPDGWTAVSAGRLQSDSARSTQLGNTVAVPVVEWISRRLVAVDGRL
jgi:DNA (cytosine-5)-methyltransferase 1